MDIDPNYLERELIEHPELASQILAMAGKMGLACCMMKVERLEREQAEQNTAIARALSQAGDLRQELAALEARTKAAFVEYQKRLTIATTASHRESLDQPPAL